MTAAPASGVEAEGNRVRVEVMSSLPQAELERIVRAVGGTIEGAIDGVRLEPPLGPLQADGEVPAPAGTFCRENGNACSIWFGGDHGVAVAEVIADMAPDATLYIASARTVADKQAAVDRFASNGVDIISQSLTGHFDGPGNGTGPMATVINNAVAAGMVWVNSAGNAGGPATNLDGVQVGQYWRGGWQDPRRGRLAQLLGIRRVPVLRLRLYQGAALERLGGQPDRL